MSLRQRAQGLKNYPYVNARVRAMRGDLITDQEYRKLAKMDLSEIAEFISNRGYGPDVDELGSDLAGEALIERAVRNNLARTYRKLSRIAPAPIADLLHIYYRKLDIQNVKTILRRTARGRDVDVSDMLLPTRELGMEELERLMELDSVEEIVRAFDLDGFDTDLDALIDDYGDLQQVEDALDIYYYTGIVETAEEAAQSRMFRRFLELEAALKNIELIIRMVRQGYEPAEIMDRIVPVPERRQIVDHAELARAGAMDEIVNRLEDTALGEEFEGDTLAEIERALERYKLKQGIRMMHTDQLGINPVLGFMVCKEVEAGNLRMIARATSEDLGSGFIERNLVGGVAR